MRQRKSRSLPLRHPGRKHRASGEADLAPSDGLWAHSALLSASKRDDNF
jgi:hypothetical protein